MKKIFLIIVLFFLFIVTANASYVIFDQDNYKVISGNNIHEKRLIASITKVMTAYVVINNANLNDDVIVGDEIDNAHGSSIYLKKGEKLKVIDLLYGMILRSGNDASITLATHISGSEENFVKLMNAEVKKWGLQDTLFQNCTGLDDAKTKNISSAYDMAYITAKAMKNKVFRKIFKTKKYSVKTNLNTHIWHNKNKALYLDDKITGGKTGYTKKAKRTLITTSSKDNINLVIVSLNMSDDFNFHVKSHNYVLNNYQNYLILNKNNLNIRDTFYNHKKYRFYLKENFHYVTQKDNLKYMKISYELYKFKLVSNSDIVGKVKVYYKDDVIFDAPIYIGYKKEIY